MRILAVSNYYPPFHAGGYGVLAHRICECLRQAGHDVTVLTSSPKDKTPHPGEHQVNVPVLRDLKFVDDVSAGKLLWRLWVNKRVVARNIEHVKPDLVYCFGIDGVGYQVYHTAVESGIPSATVVGDTWLAQAWRDLPKFDPWIGLARGRHGKGGVRFVKQIIGHIGRAMGLYVNDKPRMCRPVYVISSFLKNDLEAAGFRWTEACHLIRYPLVPPFVSVEGLPIGKDGSSSSALRVLFLSRMEPLKGPDIAIRGLAGAFLQGADVRLTLAGIGAEKMMTDLKKVASDLGVAGRISWREAPTQDALVALYRSHDVLVFPSRIIEGLGIVCLEAMACGLPVLATHMGGQLDLVKEGETGFTFACGDEKELANLLKKLSTSRSEVERLSKGALAMAEQYSLDSVTRTLADGNRDAIRSFTESVRVGYCDQVNELTGRKG